jgi:hypothetical protein
MLNREYIDLKMDYLKKKLNSKYEILQKDNKIKINNSDICFHWWDEWKNMKYEIWSITLVLNQNIQKMNIIL